jgi:hypothetical protein
MDRPFADRRPIGPVVGASTDRLGLTLVYTNEDNRGDSAALDMETTEEFVASQLQREYEKRRNAGDTNVVPRNAEVSQIGNPRDNNIALAVYTYLSLMSMEQLNAVKDATDSVVDQYIGYDTVNVALPEPYGKVVRPR